MSGPHRASTGCRGVSPSRNNRHGAPLDALCSAQTHGPLLTLVIRASDDDAMLSALTRGSIQSQLRHNFARHSGGTFANNKRPVREPTSCVRHTIASRES